MGVRQADFDVKITRGVVVDALTGMPLGRGVSITLPLEAGEVRVLRH